MSVPALLFMSRQEWEELKRACKERAGWRCQYRYSNGKRCARHEGMEVWKGEYIIVNDKRQKKITTMHMHACHIDNDPDNHQPRLECRCPMHHTQLDRRQENEEKPSWYRRGYQITTTDKLLEEVNARSLTIEEHEDGYHWHIPGTDSQGSRPTAIGAVSTAILELPYLLEAKERELLTVRRELEQLSGNEPTR